MAGTKSREWEHLRTLLLQGQDPLATQEGRSAKKDSICHECGETGHWKEDCPSVLSEMQKKKSTPNSELVRGSWFLYAIAAYYDYEDLAKWMSRCLLNGSVNEEVHGANMKVLSIPKYPTEYAAETVYYVCCGDVLALMLRSARNNKPDSNRIQRDLHWTTVKNILKYLRNTKDMFLVYGDWIFVFVLTGRLPVDWKSAEKAILATYLPER
ncbi:retrotransposon protein, putative, ty1-copia subclass [Tanacetum coccineum]